MSQQYITFAFNHEGLTVYAPGTDGEEQQVTISPLACQLQLSIDQEQLYRKMRNRSVIRFEVQTKEEQG